MPRSKATNAEKIQNVKTEIRQSENQIKKLLTKKVNAERNMRTRRLIERGALLESMIKEADTLTNEQIKRLLQTAFRPEAIREMATAFRAENAAIAAENNGGSEAEQGE